MDYAESKEAADENMAATSANKSVVNTNRPEPSIDPADPRPWPHTAIERQLAAASTLGYGAERHGAGRPRDRRKKNDRRKTHRFGLGSLLVLLWLVAVGLIAIFTDFGLTLQKAVSDVPQAVEKVVGNQVSHSTSPSSPTIQSSTMQSTSIIQQPSIQPAQTAQSAQTTQSARSARSARTVEPGQVVENSSVAETSTAEAISIPIADISLHDRPELVEQLVQVYRSQLAANPNDAGAQAAFERLQERSLSDIQVLIAQGYLVTADRSLEIVSRLFPELKDNLRYKYLVARTDYMRRQVKDESATKPEQATSVATTSAIPKITSTTPSVSSAESIVSSPSNEASSPTFAVKKASENTVSSKPEIRSVSITPGTMTDGRFVPSDGGNVFMVELSYSNFAKAFVEQNEAKLVTLLGVPEDSMVLAEVPLTISADRGTKSFAMETTNVQGYAGGKFRLNFMLNDEFLTSRTLRLSRPH